MNLQRTLSTLLLLSLAAAETGSTPLAQDRHGSIYRPSSGPIGLIADKTARRRGDLITVLIVETQNVKNEETSQLQRATTLNYALDSFNLKPNAFNLPLDIGAESQDDFNSRANYEKRGNFQARLTAMVMDVLPNGNLVIQGRREIRIDRETKVIEFSGVIRRYDVSPDNTIESELVANGRVSYSGEGEFTDTTRRHGLGGWIHDLIAWIWPF